MATLTHPATVGMDPEKLEQVQQLFHAQIAQGLHPGAGLAVYRYGHRVLDIHGGVSDVRDGGGATQPVTSQTMFVLMSSTKPLAAACLYLLKERGQLTWDDPVATYWPEFGQHGKTTVTVRHVLTHRGGFPETPKDLPPHDWPDWSKVTSAMERAPAVYTPGETIAYHPINYGWVIAELVRRIDGRPFDRFLAEDLTAPLEMEDTYVGLPQGMEDRVSPMRKMETDADPNGYSTTFSLPVAVHAVVPGAGGVASAGNLARFCAMLERRGSLDGSRVLAPETVEEGVTLQVEGLDRSLGAFVQRALGMALADERMGRAAGNPLRTFGHGGAGTSIGWADLESGLAVGYITNGFRGTVTNTARLAAVSQAVRDACI
jgi:CubicO group peptidase (beta-lactamase class C family)